VSQEKQRKAAKGHALLQQVLQANNEAAQLKQKRKQDAIDEGNVNSYVK